MNNDIGLVRPYEINNPHLSSIQVTAMVMSMNSVLAGVGDVYVALTYPKQTDARPRLADRDYRTVPGVSQDAHIGKLSVHRRVDNPANRAAGIVGKVYCKVESVTRGDGVNPVGYVNVRPDDITAFVVTGFVPLSGTPQPPIPQGV